jgi:hypothetical protein
MRRSFLRYIGVGLALLVVGLALVVRAQNFRMGGPAKQVLDRARVIDVVRMINTAEYEYRRDHGSFAVWPDLYTSGEVEKVQKQVDQWTALPITAGSQVIPGYFMTLLVSRDASSYSVSLHEAGSNDCGFSVFSDTSGLIYEGTVIDCANIGDAPMEPVAGPRHRIGP